MQLVYGAAPIAGHPRPAVNPCQVLCSELISSNRYLDLRKEKDNRIDLTGLVNRCQNHICTENYCLCRDCATKRMKCRFGFPYEAKQHPEIAKNDKNQRVFLLLRQDCDRNLNKYCPIVLSIWRANADTSPITSKDAPSNYIGKYATKAENGSDALVAEMRRLAAK